jgi:hypothetical protein
MRQLHPEAIAAIQSKALFSKAEEQLLSKVGSVSGQATRWADGNRQCRESCCPGWGLHTSAGVLMETMPGLW